MPIRYLDPFRDPAHWVKLESNPYVGLMQSGVEAGALPVLYGPALQGLAGAWQKKFPYPKVLVEIGCHKGDVLARLARAHPDWLCLGIDITFKRVVETARKAKDLANLHSILANAVAIDQLFGTEEVDGVVIFYPDPWNRKKKQLKNRLLQADFCLKLARLLKPGAFVWLKTDDPGYFAEADAFLGAAGLVRGVLHGHEVASREYISRFEEEFQKRQVAKSEGLWLKP